MLDMLLSKTFFFVTFLTDWRILDNEILLELFWFFEMVDTNWKKKIYLPSQNCLLLIFFKSNGISDIHFEFKDQTYLNSWNHFFFAETCDYVEKNTRQP